METLIETVYHARGAFLEGRSVGVGSMISYGVVSSTTFQSQYRFVSEVSADSNTQKLGSGNVASFPCSGVTSVVGSFIPAEETPNPFPAVTSTSTVYGTPLYLKADAGNTLVINSATCLMRRLSGWASIAGLVQSNRGRTFQTATAKKNETAQ